MGNTLKQNWEEPCLFWDCRLLSNMKRDNYFHCGKCGISEWAVPSTSPLFCLSLRKVSFLFAAQAWIKWAEKNSNTNICKLSGFPEQSRSRWQSAGCSIVVPVIPLPLFWQLGTTGGIPRGAARLTGSTHCWGTAVGEPTQSVPSGRMGETGHFGLSVLYKLYSKSQNARPEGHEDCGKADRETEGAEDLPGVWLVC